MVRRSFSLPSPPSRFCDRAHRGPRVFRSSLSCIRVSMTTRRRPRNRAPRAPSRGRVRAAPQHAPQVDRPRRARHDALARARPRALPAPGRGYRDDTVIVFVPAHYRFRDDEGVAALVHFHGHNTTAERAMVAHELREQLVDSKQNAILVVPQLAVFAADSSCGKLEAPGGLARLARRGPRHDGARGARDAGGHGVPRATRRSARVPARAHSGGYHAAACCLARRRRRRARDVPLRRALRRGRRLPRLGRRAAGRASASAAQARELLHRGRDDRGERRALRAQLERAGVLCADECRKGELSRHDLSHAEAVFVRTGLWHSE